MVVIIFYGTIIFMYLQPAKSRSKDQGKFVSLFYTVVTPMLNPLIYTLRNKEVKAALKKFMGKTLWFSEAWLSKYIQKSIIRTVI